MKADVTFDSKFLLLRFGVFAFLFVSNFNVEEIFTSIMRELRLAAKLLCHVYVFFLH